MRSKRSIPTVALPSQLDLKLPQPVDGIVRELTAAGFRAVVVGGAIRDLETGEHCRGGEHVVDRIQGAHQERGASGEDDPLSASSAYQTSSTALGW